MKYQFLDVRRLMYTPNVGVNKRECVYVCVCVKEKKKDREREKRKSKRERVREK